MNSVQREKIRALGMLRIKQFCWGYKSIQRWLWLLQNEPEYTLDQEDKFNLDYACYHYRKTLAGAVNFTIPTKKPLWEEYATTHHERRQASLF